MNDIPSTEYITINKTGVFIDTNKTTKYRGKQIHFRKMLKEIFVILQRENPELECVQVITSETSGIQGDVNTPSSKHGVYVWCRVGYKNGTFGPWVCCGKFHDRTNDKGDTVSAKLDCAQEGPIYCLRCLQYVPVVQDIAFRKTKLQKVCRVASLLRNFVCGPKNNVR